MIGENKDYIPRNEDNLERVYYGENKNGTNIDYNLIRKHQDWLKTNILSPLKEGEIIDIFNPVGTAVKIRKSSNKKTFDLKIDKEKILIEVTSLDFGIDKQIMATENKILFKIKKAINHIVKKDIDGFQDYYKGGVIFYSTIFNFLSKIGNLIQNAHFVEKMEISENNLDFIVFLPESASVDGRNSRYVDPPIFFVKDKSLLKLFLDKFRDKNYSVRYVE